jgi:hypothetical protein
MRQIIRIALLSLVTVLISFSAPRAEAQGVSIPSQLVSAKTAFISNGGSTAPALTSNDLYVLFYSAMKSWGKYELLTAPTNADLVFMISYSDPAGDATGGTSFRRPELTLVVLDPKTHITLWTFTEFALPNPRKPADRTMDNLLDQVKRLQGGHVTPAPAAEPAKKEAPVKKDKSVHAW